MNEANEAIWTAIAEIRTRLDEIQSGADSRDGELSVKIDSLIADSDKKESTYKAVIIVLAAIEVVLVGLVAACLAKKKGK